MLQPGLEHNFTSKNMPMKCSARGASGITYFFFRGCDWLGERLDNERS